MKYKKLKMTLLGMLTIGIVKVGGYLAKLPDNITDDIVKGVIALVGIYVGSQGVADGLSQGKTATKNEDEEGKND